MISRKPKFEKLSSEQIRTLRNQGCESHTWELVKIVKGTSLDIIRRVTFRGKILLGKSKNIPIRYFSDNSSIVQRPLLQDTILENCIIGENCHIDNIKFGISNYILGDNVYLKDISKISWDGNGGIDEPPKATPLIECGNKSIPLVLGINAQLAFILLYMDARKPYYKKLYKNLNKKLEKTGYIGSRVFILNAGNIIRTNIGDSAKIQNVMDLIHGVIDSAEGSEAILANGIFAEGFVIKSSTSIKNNVIINNSFIGEGTKLTKNVSVEESLIFSNGDFSQGELCNIVAGPFSSSHHRSSLLIAGTFSFFNAGSGTNFSNHNYRLGPMHQGYLGRGCKCGSNSYILFPACIEIFSTIIGSHKKHPDTTGLPFSLLLGSDRSSYCLPGYNLFNIGVFRDDLKWRTRDKRGGIKTDLMEASVFNLLTVSKLMDAYQLINSMNKDKDFMGKGFVIKKSQIDFSLGQYKLMLQFLFLKYLDSLLSVQNESKSETKRMTGAIKLFKIILKSHPKNPDYVDMLGLIVDSSTLNKTLLRFSAGKSSYPLVENIKKITRRSEVTQFRNILSRIISIGIIADYSKSNEKSILEWKKSIQLAVWEKVARDGKSEFEEVMERGYDPHGLNPGNFKQQHGDFEKNDSVKKIKREIFF